MDLQYTKIISLNHGLWRLDVGAVSAESLPFIYFSVYIYLTGTVHSFLAVPELVLS